LDVGARTAGGGRAQPRRGRARPTAEASRIGGNPRGRHPIAKQRQQRGRSSGSISVWKSATAALIRDGGFCDYFDPQTGEGIGGATFSWTTAIALLLEAAGQT
jgi:hypothetical protein